jgi:hypothetical protein
MNHFIYLFHNFTEKCRGHCCYRASIAIDKNWVVLTLLPFSHLLKFRRLSGTTDGQHRFLCIRRVLTQRMQIYGLPLIFQFQPQRPSSGLVPHTTHYYFWRVHKENLQYIYPLNFATFVSLQIITRERILLKFAIGRFPKICRHIQLLMKVG